MKTIAIILLIVGALLLIGSGAQAQNKGIREDDRDWIDSLAVQYRSNYRKANLEGDSLVLVHLYRELTVMVNNCNLKHQGVRSAIDEAILLYSRQRQVFLLKKKLYDDEKKNARTDFSTVL